MSQRETLKVLEKARAIIAEPRHWCRGTYARNVLGGRVSATSCWATRWCATGAIRRAAERADCPRSVPRIKWTIEETINVRLETYNDRHTHSEVLALFDRAIAHLREEAP